MSGTNLARCMLHHTVRPVLQAVHLKEKEHFLSVLHTLRHVTALFFMSYIALAPCRGCVH